MPLSIRLPADIEARLDDLANRTGRSKTFYVTEAVREHLGDLEDLYLANSVSSTFKAAIRRQSPSKN
jgi:RHH-type rel operon transcriptional repressor/antitoxin RelB